MKVRINEESIAAMLALPAVERKTLWDTELKGFGVRPRAGDSAAFVVNMSHNGKLKLDTIGRWGEMSVDAARKAVLAVKGDRGQGRLTEGDVKRLATTGVTLREATLNHIEKIRAKGARPRSIQTIEDEIFEGRHVKDWLDRPLRGLKPVECRERHKTLAEKKTDGTGGPHVANRVMRHIRAIWNTTANDSVDTSWPAKNPTKAVHWISGDRENFRDRVGEPIPWGELPAWRVRISDLTPIRHDFYLFLIFTALRRNDAATLRWDLVNTSDEMTFVKVWSIQKHRWESVPLPPRCMLRPSPKGGPKKAFLVPLSTAAIEVLERRRANNKVDLGNDDHGWVFPTHAVLDAECSLCAELGLPGHTPMGVSHLVSPGGERGETAHRMRDTWASAANQLRIPESTIAKMMNHGGQKTVTRGYMGHDLEYLAQCQQQITDFLLSKMPGLEINAPAPGRQPHHRRYTPEYKARILAEWAAARASKRLGAVKELLQKENLDSLRLTDWQRAQDAVNEPVTQKRTRVRVAKLQEENARLKALLAASQGADWRSQ